MKKLINVLLAVMLTASAAACSNSKNTADPSSPDYVAPASEFESPVSDLSPEEQVDNAIFRMLNEGYSRKAIEEEVENLGLEMTESGKAQLDSVDWNVQLAKSVDYMLERNYSKAKIEKYLVEVKGFNQDDVTSIQKMLANVN